MNALWQFETREFMCGASLLASNFEKIFATLCMRLIGLKSVTLKASNFFGSSTMFAEFIEKERRGDYLGKTVQVVPHVTDD
jgi:hypothetical protein